MMVSYSTGVNRPSLVCPVTAESMDKFPASELRSAIRMDHASDNLSTPANGGLERGDGEP